MPAALELTALLRRSADFHRELDIALADVPLDDSIHTWLTSATSRVAVEHGISICVVVEAGQLTSAHALFRTQFEATVRALWLFFSATDTWIERYMAAVQAKPLKNPGCAPGMDDMLNDLAATAPPVIAPALVELKSHIWGPLNSFVHSGIHSAALHHSGYSVDSVRDTIRNANGLSAKSAMVIATLTADEPLSARVRDIQLAHLDCLPEIIDAPGRTGP